MPSTACWRADSHQKSALGAYLDPIADKLLLSSSFVALAMEKKIPWWLTIMVLSRDVLMLVVAAVILIIQGYRPFPPSLLGKATTFFEIALVFFALLAAAYPTDRVVAADALSCVRWWRRLSPFPGSTTPSSSRAGCTRLI